MNKALTPPVAVDIQSVWKSYDDGAIQVLRGVTLRVLTGEMMALVGPSGSGKSTLLHLMGGLDSPERGSVVVRNQPLRPSMDTVQLLRHEVGFVFQLHNLIPDLSLAENCLLPTVAAGVPQRLAQERLRDLLERTGLTHRAHHKIQKLSGGERQRTALCRALMNKPKILLADEPTGALDERTREHVFALVLDLVQTEKITLVMATHDRELARRCNRVVELKDGHVLNPNPPTEPPTLATPMPAASMQVAQ